MTAPERATASPVRVAFVSSHAQLGGSERYLELLLERLGPDWIAGVVALEDGAFVERLRARGHDVAVLPAGRRLGLLPAAARLRRVVRSLRADVVHANGVKAALVACLALRGSSPPVVWVKHDFSWDGPLALAVAAGCAHVVGVSRAVTEVFGPRLARRVSVVPNGVPRLHADAAAGRARLSELLDAPPTAPVVVVPGRLHPVKGQLELVGVAPLVLEQRPDVRFLLVGGSDATAGDYADRVARRVRELGLGDAVRLAGHEERLLDLLAAADAVAVASGPHAPGYRGEGFGLVALEAMAVGGHVVALDAGAVPEVLGPCGVLASADRPETLAAALLTVIGDLALRERMRRCGPQRARESFALADTVDAMRVRYGAVATRSYRPHHSRTIRRAP